MKVFSASYYRGQAIFKWHKRLTGNVSHTWHADEMLSSLHLYDYIDVAPYKKWNHTKIAHAQQLPMLIRFY